MVDETFTFTNATQRFFIHGFKYLRIDALQQQMQQSVEMQNANLNSQLLFSKHLPMYTNQINLYVLSIQQHQMAVVFPIVTEVRMQEDQLLRRDRNSVLQQMYRMTLLPYKDHLTVPATLINLARGMYCCDMMLHVVPIQYVFFYPKVS